MPRRRLSDLLDGAGSARHAPVVLVCAPAGSGKTTLLCDWATRAGTMVEASTAAGTGSSPAPAPARVAWVSLDPDDNAVFLLWSAILTALEATGRWPPDGAPHRLGAPRHVVRPGFLAGLVAAFGELSEPVWLVLDGLHELHDPLALRGLDMLLRNLPPHLRMVLSTRSEPRLALHRLRLEGRLVEIGADQLAFTREEAVALLADQGVRLAAADLDLLMRRTEGWAAALRLAAMSLAAADGATASSVATFDGNDRAVADYLVAEILSHHPEHVTDFLLSVGVCAEVTGELAVTLSGRADAGELLDRLDRANALVSRPRRTGDPYRLHPLLRGYLRAELTRRDAAALPRLHGLAARWFVAHDQLVPALENAVEAGDTELTARLVETVGLGQVMSGRGDRLRPLLARMPPAVRDRPGVALVAAVTELDAGDIPTARATLAGLAVTDRRHTTWSHALHAATALHRSQQDGDLPAMLEALDALGAVGAVGGTDGDEATNTGDADLDLFTLVNRGTALLFLGRHRAGERDLRRALERATARRYDATALHCLVYLAAAAAADSDLAEMAERADTAIAFAARRGWALTSRCAHAYGLGAWAAYLRLDHDTAGSYAPLAVRLLPDGSQPDVELTALGAQAVVGFETAGDRHAVVGAWRDHWQRFAGRQVTPSLVGYQAPVEQRLALRVGESGWATEVADRVTTLLGEVGESHVLRATLQLHRGRAEPARALLRPVIENVVRSHLVTTVIEAWLLEAVLADRAGDGFRAHRALGEAVELAAPRRALRTFVDGGQSVRSLLASGAGRFGRHEWFAAEALAAMPAAVPGATDVLTPREQELLAELPSMRTAEEIAESLLVSVNTVKTHLRGIYQKLGVNNRRGAITVARQRGLL
ncbi:MAG TPA: LuxR C-terminal-related transcriptional regulator [Mycobacteriales bacterium]